MIGDARAEKLFLGTAEEIARKNEHVDVVEHLEIFSTTDHLPSSAATLIP